MTGKSLSPAGTKLTSYGGHLSPINMSGIIRPSSAPPLQNDTLQTGTLVTADANIIVTEEPISNPKVKSTLNSLAPEYIPGFLQPYLARGAYVSRNGLFRATVSDVTGTPLNDAQYRLYLTNLEFRAHIDSGLPLCANGNPNKLGGTTYYSPITPTQDFFDNQEKWNATYGQDRVVQNTGTIEGERFCRPGQQVGHQHGYVSRQNYDGDEQSYSVSHNPGTRKAQKKAWKKKKNRKGGGDHNVHGAFKDLQHDRSAYGNHQAHQGSYNNRVQNYDDHALRDNFQTPVATGYTNVQNDVALMAPTETRSRADHAMEDVNGQFEVVHPYSFGQETFEREKQEGFMRAEIDFLTEVAKHDISQILQRGGFQRIAQQLDSGISDVSYRADDAVFAHYIHRIHELSSMGEHDLVDLWRESLRRQYVIHEQLQAGAQPTMSGHHADQD